MTDETNPRARLDEALGEMRDANDGPGSHELIATGAMVACAEALSLLVDAHLPEPEPEPDLRESLPDDTPVGHGWVAARQVRDLFKPEAPGGRFTWWIQEARQWAAPGCWHRSHLRDPRPATVGDLRRVGVPVAEWPEIAAPEPEPSRAEQSEAKAVAERDNAIAALRAIRDRLELGVRLTDPDGGIRKGYQEALMVVETGVRSHDIDLGEGMS